MTKNSPLVVDVQDGVMTIAFNRPKARNAMNAAMRAAFCDALERAEADGNVRVLVLRGNGGSFIAGGDVKSFAETLPLTPPQRQETFVQRVSAAAPMVTALVNFPKPVIAVIDGAVAGAGISIALCSDFVIANRSARFTFAHAHIGLALDVGLSYFLPRIMGTLDAKRLAMLGEQVGAEDALRLGLVSMLVDDGQVEHALQELLSQVKTMPAQAMHSIKKQLLASPHNTLMQQLALEADLVGECAGSADFEQRVSAFVHKPRTRET
ncbi:MAG: enoyl-CoA hydratase-related protein [Pseudomonas sp.]